MIKEKFTKAVISTMMCLIGEPDFERVPFKDLLIGDYVSVVGHGGGVRSGLETSSARLAKFNPPIQYAGKLTMPHFYDDGLAQCNYIGFKLPAAGVAGWKDGEEVKTVYILFIHLEPKGAEEDELIVPWISGGGPSIRIHRAKFKKCTIDPVNAILAKWADEGEKLCGDGVRCEKCPFRLQPDSDHYDATLAIKAVTEKLGYKCFNLTDCAGLYFANAYIKTGPKK